MIESLSVNKFVLYKGNNGTLVILGYENCYGVLNFSIYGWNIH